MDIILGSAQFGNLYGISNESITSEKNAQEILVSASSKNITCIDTASAYGNSENLLGRLKAGNSFAIGTKFFINTQIWNAHSLRQIDEQINRSIDLLKIDQLSYIFVHNAENLKVSGIDKLKIKLDDLKYSGICKAIGVSIYELDELSLFKDIIGHGDIIQIPCNVFDQRLMNHPIVATLKKRGVIVHGRSVFLQGLLLMSYEQAVKKLPVAEPQLRKWRAFLTKHHIAPLDACLDFCKQIPCIDSLVLGPSSSSDVEQWSEIINRSPRIPLQEYESLSSKNICLIEPRNW